MAYRRVLLKLSGEALMGEQGYGIDPAIVHSIASDVAAVVAGGTQLAIVVGGGNIFRGLKGSAAGMDRATAQEILQSDTYAAEVREREQFYLQAGIHSVPAVIINDRHLISGGQPTEVFEQALRRIAAGEV